MRFSKEKDVSSLGSQSYLISSVLSRPFSVYRILWCVPIREKNILEGGSWSQKWTTFWLIVILALARTRVYVWRSRVKTVTFTGRKKIWEDKCNAVRPEVHAVFKGENGLIIMLIMNRSD